MTYDIPPELVFRKDQDIRMVPLQTFSSVLLYFVPYRNLTKINFFVQIFSWTKQLLSIGYAQRKKELEKGRTPISLYHFILIRKPEN